MALFFFNSGSKTFFKSILQQISNLHKEILFNVEAHFGLNGYVNKRNCRNWSYDNPQAITETLLRPLKKSLFGVLYRQN